jgi:hypothetical protein
MKCRRKSPTALVAVTCRPLKFKAQVLTDGQPSLEFQTISGQMQVSTPFAAARPEGSTMNDAEVRSTGYTELKSDPSVTNATAIGVGVDLEAASRPKPSL